MSQTEILENDQESQIKSEDSILPEDSEDDSFDAQDEEKSEEYKENHWPLPPDEPKGFTFKGKTKLMAKACEELKKILKKKAKGYIGNIQFSVSDVKKIGPALEAIVEVTDASGSGKAIVNFWGPNKKTKQCTILVKKPKEHDERFVKIVAKQIVQKVLDCVICGDPPDNIFKNTSVKSIEKQGNTHECEMCAKTFPAKRYLKSHMTRIHISDRQFVCDICAQAFKNELDMKKHKFKCINKSKSIIKGTKISTVRKIDDLDSNSDQVQDLDSPEYKKKKNTHDVSGISIKEDITMDVDVHNDTNSIDNVDTNEVPTSWKPYIFDDEFILKMKPDGACGFRAGAEHIFGDQEYGPEFAIQIYRHIHQYWETYYNKIFSFPYKRQVGVSGQWVEFHEEKELLEYLKSSTDVSHLWADSQELQAMANIYQIQIKVLSVMVNDQEIPRVLHIGPDNDFIEGAKEPLGKIPNMTLLYIEKSHYDLITSRKGNLIKKTSDDKKISNERLNLDSHLKQELEEIRIANKKLITAYSASLQKVKSLEDQLKNDRLAFKNNADIMTKSKPEENLDEKILLEGKISGFSRTGPQSQPIAKSNVKKVIQCNKCDVCKKFFDSKDALEKHEHSHNEDGDWNCDNCGFEANSKQLLDKHIKCAHQKLANIETQIFKNQFSCKFCNIGFKDNQTLLQHRQSIHKTFKPCKFMSDCKYQNDCSYNHSQIEANSFICYECGKLFPAVSDLMNHRKNSHVKPMCKRFLMNACNFATDKCWYSHINDNESVDIEMKSPEKLEKQSSQQNNRQVFQDTQQILVPPGNNPNQPTMAMWIQMKMKMEELTQMMATIQQIVQ